MFGGLPEHDAFAAGMLLRMEKAFSISPIALRRRKEAHTAIGKPHRT
jgi:hypothetical protein